MNKTKTMIASLGLLAISLVGLPTLVGATASCNGTVTTIVQEGDLEILYIDQRGGNVVKAANVYAESNGIPGLQSGGHLLGAPTGIFDLCQDPSGVFDTLLVCGTQWCGI